LLALVVESEQKLEAISKELQQRDETIAGLQEQLSQRELGQQEAGSIAEAALKVNGIFEAAQQAAEDYLSNIRAMTERQQQVCGDLEEQTRRDSDSRLKDTIRSCEAMRKKAEDDCWQLEQDTREACEKKLQETREVADSYWTELSRRLESFYEAHQGMKELLSANGLKPVISGPEFVVSGLEVISGSEESVPEISVASVSA